MSFCFSLLPSSRFCDCKFRHRICQTRTSSACEFNNCGNSAPVPSYRCSAESCRLWIVRSRRFSFSSSCKMEFIESSAFTSGGTTGKTYTDMTVSIAQLILYRSQPIQASRRNPLPHFTDRFVHRTLANQSIRFLVHLQTGIIARTTRRR